MILWCPLTWRSTKYFMWRCAISRRSCLSNLWNSACLSEAELLSRGGGEAGAQPAGEGAFQVGVVCEKDEEARTVVWETSKAAGVRGGVVTVEDGEHWGSGERCAGKWIVRKRSTELHKAMTMKLKSSPERREMTEEQKDSCWKVQLVCHVPKRRQLTDH